MNLCKSGAQMGWVNNNKKSIFSFFASAIAASPKLLTECQNCHFCTYTLHMVQCTYISRAMADGKTFYAVVIQKVLLCDCVIHCDRFCALREPVFKLIHCLYTYMRKKYKQIFKGVYICTLYIA